YHALGVCVMVASATEEWLVRPVAQALGVAHLACTQDGDSVPCFGPHKLARVHALRAALAVRLRHTASLEPCVAYSDSLHDAPLLEAAEVAVAVDPEPGLASLAQRRGWPVVSFRNA
ncbi:MAG: haloacid dehalogenase-like hydrolase, partial [Desulfovibrio sp.]|nr:haloacid dehalogenase-like hydrolase [Desulfovibrio sp.]